jgi:hypothetical protein
VIGRLHGSSDAEIGGGEDVRSTELPEQEHVGCPRPNAANLGELTSSLVVRQLAKPIELEAAVERPRRQIPKRPRLGTRQADRAQLRIRRAGDRRGCIPISDEGLQSAEYRRRRPGRDLLPDDRAGERPKAICRPARARQLARFIGSRSSINPAITGSAARSAVTGSATSGCWMLIGLLSPTGTASPPCQRRAARSRGR